MDERITRAVEQLRAAGVELQPGLSEAEVAEIEHCFGFRFGREHRELLRTCLPVSGMHGSVAGHGFWNWREESPDSLRAQLDWPVEGVLFDVEHNGFWDATWGPRPPQVSDQMNTARAELRTVPTLVPLFGHRYMVADRAPEPCPVLSVWQTDIVYYGWDLNSYLAHEFGMSPLDYSNPPTNRQVVPFWGQFT